ncbi:MAG: class I SAM-dependent methyltransferase [Promethearchaeota archaeon]
MCHQVVQAMDKVELGWNEFWAEIFRIRHRRQIPGIEYYDQIMVEFCMEALGLQKGSSILDIACGAGDQSVEFAKRGLKVTAFDIADTLIEAAKESAESHGVSVNFFAGDMRKMSFDSQFDAAVLLSHSFGFFNHEENKHVLKGVYAALKSKGCFLLDLMNPYNLPRFQRSWTTLDGGYLLSEPHVLDAPAGVLTGRPAVFIDTENDRIVLMDEDALSNNDIRMYTALEIRKMLEEVGFKKIEYYGHAKLPRLPYAADSERMIVIAHR